MPSQNRQFPEPVIGEVGFYRPDPSHAGKNPIMLLDRHEGQILTEDPNGLQFLIDVQDWMGVEELKDELLRLVGSAPESPFQAEMRSEKIRGRISAMADAVNMALNADSILERYSQTCLARPSRPTPAPLRMRAA